MGRRLAVWGVADAGMGLSSPTRKGSLGGEPFRGLVGGGKNLSCPHHPEYQVQAESRPIMLGLGGL